MGLKASPGVVDDDDNDPPPITGTREVGCCFITYAGVSAMVGGASIEPCEAGKANLGLVDDNDTDPPPVNGSREG